MSYSHSFLKAHEFPIFLHSKLLPPFFERHMNFPYFFPLKLLPPFFERHMNFPYFSTQTFATLFWKAHEFPIFPHKLLLLFFYFPPFSFRLNVWTLVGSTLHLLRFFFLFFFFLFSFAPPNYVMCPWTCNSLGTPFQLSFNYSPKSQFNFPPLWYVDCSLLVVLNSRCGLGFFQNKSFNKTLGPLYLFLSFSPFVGCFVLWKICQGFHQSFLHLVSFFLSSLQWGLWTHTILS